MGISTKKALMYVDCRCAGYCVGSDIVESDIVVYIEYLCASVCLVECTRRPLADSILCGQRFEL